MRFINLDSIGQLGYLGNNVLAIILGLSFAESRYSGIKMCDNLGILLFYMNLNYNYPGRLYMKI